MLKNFIGRFDDSMLEELGEFEKRYSGTFLWLKFPEKQWEMYQFVGLCEDKALFSHPILGEVVLNRTTNCEIEVKWPKTHFFNYKNSVFWGSKLPERQWKRAPCNKNYQIICPISTLFTPYSTKMPITQDILTAAFQEPQHESILQAINSFKDSDITARAISNKFAVSLPPFRKSYYILWYLAHPVAIIHVKPRTIEIKYPHVRQEIQDYIRDNELNTWQIL